MKILEFENTQGINLQYPVANIVDRGVSFMLDIMVLAVVLGILSLLFSSGVSDSTLIILILAPIFIFYSLLFEILNDGRSPGKLITGLKVIRVDGRVVNIYDYLMRWMFRWLDIYMTFGSLAAIMVGATPRSQRIGDMLADTTVIRTRNLRLPLQTLLSLNTLSDYTPQYKQVLMLEEQQILAIKETLSRAKKYRNDTNDSLVKELAHRLSVVLDVSEYNTPENFLKTIIKDYIALTR